MLAYIPEEVQAIGGGGTGLVAAPYGTLPVFLCLSCAVRQSLPGLSIVSERIVDGSFRAERRNAVDANTQRTSDTRPLSLQVPVDLHASGTVHCTQFRRNVQVGTLKTSLLCGICG